MYARGLSAVNQPGQVVPECKIWETPYPTGLEANPKLECHTTATSVFFAPANIAQRMGVPIPNPSIQAIAIPVIAWGALAWMILKGKR